MADNARLTFKELNARTDSLAKELESLGANKDTIIATLLLDGLAMIELAVAAAKLGATLLALNWRLAPAELRYIMSDASPDIYFISECFTDLFNEAGGKDAYAIQAGDASGALSAFNIDPKSCVEEQLNIEVIHSDRWYLVYTSGTTGQQKGCQHSQGAYFLNVLDWAQQIAISEQDCLLARFPLFHVNGFGTFLCALIAGAKTVIPQRGLSLQETLRLSVQEQVTYLPVLMELVDILALQTKLQLQLQLRMLIAPGGAFPRKFLESVASGLGVDMRCMYGQTEAGGWISMHGLEDQILRPRSCGKAMPYLATRIIDDQGQEVATGLIGELLIKGESITTGYLNLPEATAETIVDSWLHTGDLFYQDEEGFLYLTGRKKELIKTGGENVYPAEVDSVLVKHPAIVDACVFGVPDPQWGEAVKACLVLAPGASITRQEIVAWCRDYIAGYKKPQYIEFIDEIPRDYNGKPLRKLLKDRPIQTDQATT